MDPVGAMCFTVKARFGLKLLGQENVSYYDRDWNLKSKNRNVDEMNKYEISSMDC